MNYFTAILLIFLYICIIFKYSLQEKFSNNYISEYNIIAEIIKYRGFLIIKYSNHNNKKN